MILGFAILLLCQLIGEALSRGIGLPIPGPVLGLVLLFAWLQGQRRVRRQGATAVADTELGQVADGLLRHLALLFVPAGAGVVQNLGLLTEHAVALATVLIGSTALTLVVTVYVFLAVARRVGEDPDGPVQEPAT